MTTVRIWAALAALGAGLIHLAVAPAAPMGLGVALGLLGAVEALLAVLLLVSDRVHAAVLIVLLAPVAGVIAVVLVERMLPPWLPLGAALTATGFDCAAALGVVIRLVWSHAAPRRNPRPMRPHPIRLLVSVAVGAAVLAALTTPALVATQHGGSDPMAPASTTVDKTP